MVPVNAAAVERISARFGLSIESSAKETGRQRKSVHMKKIATGLFTFRSELKSDGPGMIHIAKTNSAVISMP
jgi:hypothetical protein